MADCKACGEWFGTTTDDEICPACERALKRLKGYAKPVVHGEWGKETSTAECKNCGHVFPAFLRMYAYCPNCGAKMDGGAET